MFYGHFDKQPHLTKEWREGLHPTKPVIEDGKLYGRGGADDGYSIFAMMTALKIVQDQGIPHPRCIFVMEGDEESGTGDVEYYIEKYHERLLFGRDCFDGDMMALLKEMDFSEHIFRRLTETNATNLLAVETQGE